ncbi:MAG: hypothetical protein AAF610_06040 [Pseudomonadota bacterium]
MAEWCGLLGFTVVLCVSMVRLGNMAAGSFALPWSALHIAVFAANLIFMLYVEGYRGFQKRFSPRFAKRAVALRTRPSWLEAALAPLVLMGLFFAPRRQLIVSWLLTIGIVIIVLIYRALPQPWRGILDAGVLVALLWGTLATFVLTVNALRR